MRPPVAVEEGVEQHVVSHSICRLLRSFVTYADLLVTGASAGCGGSGGGCGKSSLQLTDITAY